MNLEFRTKKTGNLRNLLPAMHGVWSIWFVATLLGIVKSETPSFIGILASLIVLFSIQPLQDLIQKGEIGIRLVFPASLTFLFLALAILFDGFLYILTPYIFLFLLQIILRKNFESYLVIGSLLVTLPFPLIIFLSGNGFPEIASVWIILSLVVLHSIFIAQSVIGNRKTPPFISFSLLLPLALLILPINIAFLLILLSFGIIVFTMNVTVKMLGRSLLLYQLIFVFLMAFT